MRSIHRSLRFAFTAAMVVTLLAITTGAVAADGPKGKVAYNSVPKNLPGNVPSQPFQAQQTFEFGDSVLLGAGGRTARSVDVVMSSWGCESGTWNVGDCVTTKGAKFTHPITLNLYSVNAAGNPDVKLLTDTQTFAIPFRPSADARCVGADAGKWYSKADGACYNGLIHTITFKLSGHVTLPTAVIWTVAYNTTSWGYAPMGTGAACFSTSAGCGYDSLNVGVWSFAGQPSKGTDVDPAGAVIYSHTPSVYCDGGAGGVDILRRDDGCWGGYRPLATIRTSGGHHSDSDDGDDEGEDD